MSNPPQEPDPGPPVPGPRPIGNPPYGYEPPRRRNIGLIIGVAGALFVLLAAIVTVVLFVGGGGGKSDEEQIEDAARMAATTKGVGLYCAEFRSDISELNSGPGELTDIAPPPEADLGKVTKVENIRVDGDSATADITTEYSGHEITDRNFAFKKEDGDWKLCPKFGAL